MLCLGAQNLNERHTVNLGIAKTASLPSGFIIGVSFVLGVLSGSGINTLIMQSSKKNYPT